MRHFLSTADLESALLETLLSRSAQFLRDPTQARRPQGTILAFLMERPSLRTRLAYEAALVHLGGRCVSFEIAATPRESVEDRARTLSHLADVVALRTRDHAVLETLAQASTVPVINALSDREHPVEVLADALTLREHWGSCRGRRMAFVGHGGNLCRSLLFLAPLLDMDLVVASPEPFAPPADVVARAQNLAQRRGTRIALTEDPFEALQGADAVYTDNWPEGFLAASPRRGSVPLYRVDEELLVAARPNAVVLHCLPAHRDEEIAPSVLEGPRSLAFRRLDALVPVTMAVVEHLLTPSAPPEGAGQDLPPPPV